MKLLIKLLLFVLLISCSKEVDLTNQINKKLVLNCFLVKEEPIKVYLTSSVFILDNQFPEIKDATVKLFENDIYIADLSNWKYLLEHSCIIQLLFVYLYDNQIYVNYASDKINRSRKG